MGVVAQQFSPRYETRGDRVVIDVRGLDRLFGTPKAIGDELRREAADRGLRVHVAVASTQTAAVVLALSRPGVVVVAQGREAEAIASLPLDVLCRAGLSGPRPAGDDRDPERVALRCFDRGRGRHAGCAAAARRRTGAARADAALGRTD